MNWWGSGFIAIINYAALAVDITPTPGSSFMITESLNNRMITESNDNMITE